MVWICSKLTLESAFTGRGWEINGGVFHLLHGNFTAIGQDRREYSLSYHGSEATLVGSMFLGLNYLTWPC